MSIENGWEPCALCGEQVNTNDSERVRYDEDDLIGVAGAMHVGCFDEALQAAVAIELIFGTAGGVA